MALITCPECGRTVSDRAGNCPNCGAPLHPSQNTIPQNGYQNQYGKEQSTYQQSCPKTWMTESILVTLFCCLPFGIVGIINASKVSSAYSAGSYDEAFNASHNAGKWTKIGFWCGLAVIIIYVVVAIAAGTFASLSQ